MYAEVMIVTNTFFNYTVLAFANKIGWIENHKRYLFLSALTAGVITVVFSHSMSTVFLSFFAMILIAFWKKRSQIIKAIILTLLASVFAGGLLTAIAPLYVNSSNLFMIINFALIATGGLYFLAKHVLHLNIAQSERELLYPSNITLFGVSKELTLFIDSGNVCTEPLSNDPVHFVAADMLKEVLPPPLFVAIRDWEFDGMTGLGNIPKEYASKVRLIPLATIHKHKTWVVGIKYDQWIIGDQALPKGYIVMTRAKEKFPHEADGILHSSSYFHLKKRSVG
ncbi:sigma-E processing peptidase SpoIIGA [Psychrobacillus sp. OK028]|uniref:sigma-E processing peptidase SpoIIGA n=1 Tax=Psychrobacillus sp. OK028 TaxID=1884359 RepID=UPI0008893A94|nr:sigma-E processing peptidase SpoIIGA [Psychrobacillus sp. OK028]SDM51927.1 sigma-E processing peptidase SpoIIGA [Psychrobacillus sp. OK028]